MDERLIFVEVLQEHIRDWQKAAKAWDEKSRSVELEAAQRHLAKKEAGGKRARIKELRELITFLRNR
jgi:hypothetical protein